MAVTQLDKANSFRALHHGTRAFVIPNAWDAGSARVLAGLGFAAIATSSYATAGAYGRRDGRITRDQALAHARAIVEATDLPVSADLESGFGATATDVAETYREAAAAGLVGATIEDLTPARRKDQPLFDIGEATERVAAAVAATGVRRISLAGSLYRAAMAGLVGAARELQDKGTFGYIDTALPSAELAGFMRG
jgi:2-methylisocitrate lyase-like PEP mutase family enzyme